ncbi:MAG: DNA-processing protein DprA [Thermodesulfobacteriota bacterium]
MADPDRQEDHELFYWLALCLTPGVGPRRFADLRRRFRNPAAVFRASAQDLAQVPGLSEETVKALTRFDWGHKVENEIEQAGRLGVHFVTLEDDAYPVRLKEIPTPPPLLWLKGDLQASDQAAVALVGSRSATEYGLQTAVRLAGELAAAGVTVVSGGALGIDTAAHGGALEAGGRTLCVLGCGLDVDYPRANRALFQRITGQGALISEFPLGTIPQAANFPIRNRIISGLSVAVVVVEAAEKSGALITARLALEQNRDVLAVPGRALAAKSAGANSLLKQGARLVESGQDVLDEILPQLQGLSTGPALTRQPRLPWEKPPAPEPDDLSPDEKNVWAILAGEPAHVDALGRRLGLPPPKLATLLLEMEIKGLVKQLPGQRYTRNS